MADAGLCFQEVFMSHSRRRQPPSSAPPAASPAPSTRACAAPSAFSPGV